MSDDNRSDSGTDAPLSNLHEALGDVREAVERAERAALEVGRRAAVEGERSAPKPSPQWSWRARLWACPAETRLGIHELVEALGVSKSWVYARTKTDADDPLPFRKLGGSLYFVAGEVRHWIRTHEEAPVQGPSWSPVDGGLGLADTEDAA